jgi:hypothetical protein
VCHSQTVYFYLSLILASKVQLFHGCHALRIESPCLTHKYQARNGYKDKFRVVLTAFSKIIIVQNLVHLFPETEPSLIKKLTPSAAITQGAATLCTTTLSIMTLGIMMKLSKITFSIRTLSTMTLSIPTP